MNNKPRLSDTLMEELSILLLQCTESQIWFQNPTTQNNYKKGGLLITENIIFQMIEQ